MVHAYRRGRGLLAESKVLPGVGPPGRTAAAACLREVARRWLLVAVRAAALNLTGDFRTAMICCAGGGRRQQVAGLESNLLPC